MTQALTIKDDMSLMDLGSVLSKSGYFSDVKDVAQAIVKVLAGREMGFGPIASMTGIYIVKGKPSMGANLIAAAVKRSGKYDYRVRTHTVDECSIEFYERIDGKRELIGVSTFTKADAIKASTQNLDKFPRNMLFARAMSNGAKWYCADVFGGPVYTPEELGATVDDDGEVVGTPKWELSGSAPTDHDAPATTAQPETPRQISSDRDAELEAKIMSDSPASTVPPEPTQTKSAVKKCSIKTPLFASRLIPALAEKTKYYNDGKDAPQPYHVLGSAAKCGYSEITSDNVEAVLNDLVQHAIEQQLEVPQAQA